MTFSVCWITERGSTTGAGVQAKIVEEHFGDDAEFHMLFPEELGVDIGKPYVVAESGMIHPTTSLVDAVKALDPDITVFHMFEQALYDAHSEIQTFTVTVARMGINLMELSIIGPEYAAQIPDVIEFLNACDHVIAASELTARKLRCVGVPEHCITVIPSMVGVVDKQDPNEAHGPNIGSLGRISPNKNQVVLILALAGIRYFDPPIAPKLVLSGQQSTHSNPFKDMATQLGIRDRVGLTGFIDPETDFFPVISVHAFPSVTEHMPLAVLEAARAGVPTVTSDNMWATEFDSMVTCKMDDPWEWAETLHELLVDDEYRIELAGAQQAEVSERFAADVIVGEYHALFERLLDEVAPLKIDAEVLQ